MDFPDDVLPDPNAGAYERVEARRGPPLAYVGEKLKAAVVHAHALLGTLKEESGVGAGGVAAGTGTGHASMARHEAFATFHYSLRAFLALYNMMGMVQEDAKVRALLAMDGTAFREWLDRVEREGSVTG